MELFNWSEVPEEQLNPTIARKMIHGETMTLAQLRLSKGAVVPMHHHVNEQISMVQSGALRFQIGGEEKLLKAGQNVRIPPNVPHMVTAEEDSVAVDLFSPVREDWIRGDDSYLRK